LKAGIKIDTNGFTETLSSLRVFSMAQQKWWNSVSETASRSDDVHGFAVLPRCWVVERAFGWMMRHRRLVRDYECTESMAEAWIQLAMIRIQLRRLA
jgi:transposase